MSAPFLTFDLRTFCLFLLAVVCVIPVAGAQNLSLEDAERMAIESSLEVRLAETEVDRRKAARREASSAYFPKLHSRLIPPFIGRESGFFADQILWDFGRTKNRVKSRRSLTREAVMSKENARREALRAVRKAFYTVLLEEARLLYAEKSHLFARMQLERGRILEKNGRISTIELAERESEEKSIRFDAHKVKNSLQSARFELFQLLGIKDGGSLTLEVPRDAEFDLLPAEDVVASAFGDNAYLRALAERLKSDKANIGAARAEFLPVIYGRVAYRFKGEGAETPAFIAGAGASIPIFEGFSRFAKLDRMRAAKKGTEIKIEIEKRRLENEIRRLLLKISQADSDILLSRQVLGTAEKKIIVAREKEQLGAASLLDLTFSEREYAKFYLKYEESVYNRRVLLVDLIFLAGGLPSLVESGDEIGK